jgi:tRNA threonylcarbamoyladenosine biosynthesis protein TsaB
MDEAGPMGEYFLNAGIPHSESLLVMIDELLRRTGLKLEEVAGLAVSIGPGAFTGLRVGVSVAKGLSLSRQIPLIPVPTLDALAHAVPYSQHLLCPILDAKKKQVYAALYHREENDLLKLTPDLLITPAELAAKITRPVIFLGDAVDGYGDSLRHILGDKAGFAPTHLRLPRALQVARLGLVELRAGRTVSAHELVPRYVRRPEAEVNWEARLAQQKEDIRP